MIWTEWSLPQIFTIRDGEDQRSGTVRHSLDNWYPYVNAVHAVSKKKKKSKGHHESTHGYTDSTINYGVREVVVRKLPIHGFTTPKIHIQAINNQWFRSQTFLGKSNGKNQKKIEQLKFLLKKYSIKEYKIPNRYTLIKNLTLFKKVIPHYHRQCRKNTSRFKTSH